MELIFIWINKSDFVDVLNNSGICFDANYTIEFNFDLKTLTVKENPNTLNVFKNDVITNISAVVGKNGAGKSTLLSIIYHNDVMLLTKESKDEYFKHSDGRNELRKTVQVFRNDVNNIVAFHNMPFNVIGFGCEIINVNDKAKYCFRTESDNQTIMYP